MAGAAVIAYDPPLVEAVLHRRYKRFLADVELPDGRVVVAHCPNPGAMTACWAPGVPCLVTPHDNPRRKLQWTLEQVRMPGGWVLVNTTAPNAVVADAIAAGRVPELAGYPVIEREKPYPEGFGGRVDVRLGDGPRRCWVEVKNVTLVEGDRALFPDAKTARGVRHLVALAGAVAQGHRGVLLFHVGRPDGTTVGPADHVDPAYGAALRQAMADGVEVLAYRCRISREGLELGGPVPLVVD